MKQSELLDYCQSKLEEIIKEAEALKELSPAQLTYRPDDKSWNTLEVIEHLNRYSDFYLSEIEQSIAKSAKHPTKEKFRSGILGGYFAKSMLPKENGQIANPMKTFKDKNTLNAKVDHLVIEQFLEDQGKWLKLVTKARTIDLNKAKTTITISSWIKLKLGDTFQFLINHELRHFEQIRKTLKQKD